MIGSPTVVDGTMVLGDARGVLHAFTLGDGTLPPDRGLADHARWHHRVDRGGLARLDLRGHPRRPPLLDRWSDREARAGNVVGARVRCAAHRGAAIGLVRAARAASPARHRHPHRRRARRTPRRPTRTGCSLRRRSRSARAGNITGSPGCCRSTAELLAELLVELARSADWSGGLVFVNGHGGNLHGVRDAVRRITFEERRVMSWSPQIPGERCPRRTHRDLDHARP